MITLKKHQEGAEIKIQDRKEIVPTPISSKSNNNSSSQLLLSGLTFSLRKETWYHEIVFISPTEVKIYVNLAERKNWASLLDLI